MLGVIGSEFGNDMEFTNAKPKVHSLAWHTSTFVFLAFMTSFISCFFSTRILQLITVCCGYSHYFCSHFFHCASHIGCELRGEQQPVVHIL